MLLLFMYWCCHYSCRLIMLGVFYLLSLLTAGEKPLQPFLNIWNRGEDGRPTVCNNQRSLIQRYSTMNCNNFTWRAFLFEQIDTTSMSLVHILPLLDVYSPIL